MGVANRKSDFTKEKGDKICEMISAGETLRSVLKSADNMPDQTTVWQWREDNALFRLAYARARVEQTRSWADEMRELSVDATRDYKEVDDKNGNTKTVYDRDHVDRVRLRIDTLKWLMAKINAVEFGDKQDGRTEPMKDINGGDLLGQIASIMSDLGASLSDQQRAALTAAIGAGDV